MLEANDLVVVRNGDRTVLDGVSLRLAAGELVAVEGPSGGGKSTLLWTLARLHPLASGALVLDGEPAAEIPVRDWRRRVMLLLQKPALPAPTIRENLVLPFALAGRDDFPDDAGLRRELDALDLGDVELDRSADDLSVGQAGRVAFLRAVLASPDHLLLDEPAAALDEESAARLHARLGAYVDGGGSALLVRHHDGGRTPSRTLRLADGTLAEVTP